MKRCTRRRRLFAFGTISAGSWGWNASFRKYGFAIYQKIGRLGFVKSDIKTQLLDEAQRLVQTCGHNGFSFRDLSREVGIRTASIHYHFPTKTDLAVALVRRYREALGEAMADIAVKRTSLAERLEATAKLYIDTLNNDARVCVCAALAGEYLSLPREVQIELGKLISDSEGWIVRFLAEGRSRAEITKESDPASLARLWYAALQGALLIARSGTRGSFG